MPLKSIMGFFHWKKKTLILLVNSAKQNIINFIKSGFFKKDILYSCYWIYSSIWCLPTPFKRDSWFQCQKVEKQHPNLCSWNWGKILYSNKSAGWNPGYKLEMFVYCFSNKGRVTGSLNFEAVVTKLPFVHHCSHAGRQKCCIFKVMREVEKCWTFANDGA